MLHYQWNIIGHDENLLALEKELIQGRLAHAYMFAGSDHIGKFSIAKRFATILQCKQGYCRSCNICREIEKNYHGDTFQIIDNGDSIKIEDVREILPHLYMSRQSSYKILIVQNVERMTTEAANAFLKILEDPPDGVLFLFTTSNLKQILPTLLSRLRVYTFKRLSEKNIVDILQKNYPFLEEEQREKIIAFALGKPGIALAFLENSKLYRFYDTLYGEIELLLRKKDRVAQFLYIADMLKAHQQLKNNDVLKDFLDIFTLLLRKEMLHNIDNPERLQNILVTIRNIQKAYDLLKRNINKKLLLENLFLAL